MIFEQVKKSYKKFTTKYDNDILIIKYNTRAAQILFFLKTFVMLTLSNAHIATKVKIIYKIDFNNIINPCNY